MKKINLSLMIFSIIYLFMSPCASNAELTEPVVKIDVPSETIDFTYEQEPSAASKAIEATKKATKNTVSGTKKITKKTVSGTKNITKKTVDGTKKLTDKTVDGTKGLIDNLNPNRPITVEELQQDSEIKTLKNERKEIVSAYNSRIKDYDAKIKATEKSTKITDTEKQNQVYTLSKQKRDLELQRDAYTQKYNNQIKTKQKKAKLKEQ